MRKYLFWLLLMLGGALSALPSFAQTASFTALSGGLTGTTMTSGQSQAAVIGFSATVSGGSITFTQFNVNWSGSSAQNYIANGTLYRSSSSTFNSSTPGTPVGNVVINGTNITLQNLSETITNTTNNYFLVVDVVFSNVSTDYSQQIYINTGSFAVDANSNTYTGYLNDYRGFTFSAGVTPYAVQVANISTGVTANGTILTSGTTTIPLFGFSLQTSTAATFSTININSTVSNIGSYFTNFKLYSNTSATFVGATATGITGTASGSYVTFSGTVTGSTTAKYYFLVADCSVTGSLPVNVQFNFLDGQSTTAFVRTLPSSGNYDTFTANGNTFNINAANVTVTNLTGGLTSGTLTASQTGVVLFGCTITSSPTISLSNININSTNASASSYFGSGVLYRCNGTNYSTATSKVAVGTVTFSGAYANVVFSTPETITSSGTNQNYFLVANCTGAAPNTTTTVAFNFTNGQSQAAIVQTSPTSSYNTYSISGNTLTLPGPGFIVTSENSASNGITQGSLAFGESGIVLFGVGIQAVGAAQTITKINFKTSGSESSWFGNFYLYRSTSPTFPGGSPLYGSTAVAGCNCGNVAATVSEAIPLNTTYYYFLVADFNVGYGTTPSTFTISFASGQSNSAIVTSAGNYNTYNVTGTSFNLASAENWTGATSTDFLNAGNYKATNGGSGFVPTSTTIINIGGGGQTYTNQPILQSGTTTAIGGLIFGTTGTPTLTINSGQTLTVNTSMQVGNTTVNIAGPGTLTLASTAITNTSSSTTLNLSGGITVNNAGTFNTGTSSNITLAGSSTLSNSGTFTLASTAKIGSISSSALANSGTFTLASDATSSASIGQVTGTGSITGSYSVQRFITGGSGMRGYRLMSSPAYNGTANSNNVYSVNYVAASSFITGTTPSANGIDQTGNPTLYLFRENMAPNQSTFTSGNFRGIGNMGTTTTNISYSIDGDGSGYNIPAGNGFLFFFRGDRAVATIAQETVTSYVPTSTTLTAKGTLNYGSITYKNWYQPTTSGLMYTTATANTAIRGYNLMGNPYPSSISWTSLYNANSTNLSNVMYAYNPATAHYGSYQAGGSGTQNVGDVIGSGQGFFAIATNTGTGITFTEAVKSTSQPSTLLMGIPANTASTPQYIHIKMVKDSVNYDDAIVGFKPNADTRFVENEDATYLNGNAPPEVFSTLSSDSVKLSINNMPLPGANGQVVKMYISATNSGTYTFKRSELVGIPTLYQIWLKDNLQKDSIDFRANDTYSFSIDNSNAATYGSGRFQLVFSQSPALALHLLNFAASKATGVVQSQLTWTVENESSYTTFYVQRSTDGQNFSSIGSLQSDGSGTYSFVDKNPVLGINYYRLQLMDIDNNISYSQVIVLQYSNLSNSALASTLSVYPNPAHEQINISLNATNASNAYKLMITNNTGEVVKQINLVSPTSSFDVSAFIPGMYYVVLADSSTNLVIAKSKFVKL